MSLRSISRPLLPAIAVFCALGLAAPAVLATPPEHAPAHGYRAKQDDAKAKPTESEPRKGIEVIYDSERGIYVGVNLPDVFFHEGRYYRESGDGEWQISLSGDGDWSVSVSSSVPDVVVKAKRAHPGPAKRSKGKKK